MKVFSIDFSRLAVLLLPTMLRKQIIMSFLEVVMRELQSIYDGTIPSGFRQRNLYRLNHNGQVFSLRKVLNDAFLRNRDNGFEIIDAEITGDWLITYDESDYRSELIPILTDKDYLKIHDEMVIMKESGNFIVLYPADLTDDDKARMRTIVNYYKLVSRTPIYRIKN